MTTPLQATSYKLQARGFTLIELLVVIAIIGLLSSIVLVSLKEAKWKGRVAAAKLDMLSLRTELETLVDPISGAYPAGLCTANGPDPDWPGSPYPLKVGRVPVTIGALDQSLKNVVALSVAITTNANLRGVTGPLCWTNAKDGNGRIKEWAVWFDIVKSCSAFCIDSLGVAVVKGPACGGVNFNDYDGLARCLD